MEVQGTIKGIKYKTYCADELPTISKREFDMNQAPSSCILQDGNSHVAISKWVSPKRTRSYPYERVYNTLLHSKRITVIPVVKDEGQKGDRDFLQWDTVSLMSLLDVYVIIAYYTQADAREAKITNQQFDNAFILAKIEEMKNYHSSALHWNLKELQTLSTVLLPAAQQAYQSISRQTGVRMHHERGLETFRKRISESLEQFMEFSRQKAKDAQGRELLTVQPKEFLSSATKAKITITNYLGGEYHFTVDEVRAQGSDLHLIESKHTQNSTLPSVGDIKDGLLKMILYTNLKQVYVGGKAYNALPILVLSSARLEGELSNEATSSETEAFCQRNSLMSRFALLQKLFTEARENEFRVHIRGLR